MSILWGTKAAGEDVAVGDGCLIIGGPPDAIRTPPELGGQEFRVERVYWRVCPCGGPHECESFSLLGTDLQVSECPAKGFLWWRPRR